MDLSIVILNWNGLRFLKECIPSVITAAEACGHNCELTVVDNGSSDQSMDYIKSNFSRVRALPLQENLNFTKAMNIGIREAKYPVVICLNNDVVVDRNFIAPMAMHFLGDKMLFAVAAKMLLCDKKTLNFGRAIGGFRYGFFVRKIIDSAMSINALYACGGGFAVDKNKFLELGGFDEDMIVYWEDLDLCYRAWKQGWRTIYEPKSIIYHRFHGTNLKKYGKNGIDVLSGQNYFLFIVKNIHDRIIFFQQLLFIPLLILLTLVSGKIYFARGILQSVKRWPIFLKKRKTEKQKAIFSDRAVLRMSNR